MGSVKNLKVEKSPQLNLLVIYFQVTKVDDPDPGTEADFQNLIMVQDKLSPTKLEVGLALRGV